MSLPFSMNQREVQQVMGTTNMFLQFTPDYASIAKDITDMSYKTFNWDGSTWNVDHRSTFDRRFKQAVSNSLTLHYPNYDVDWILRTNASITCLPIIRCAGRHHTRASNCNSILQN